VRWTAKAPARRARAEELEAVPDTVSDGVGVHAESADKYTRCRPVARYGVISMDEGLDTRHKSSTSDTRESPNATRPPPMTADHTRAVSVLQHGGKHDSATYGREAILFTNSMAHTTRMPFGFPVDPDVYFTMDDDAGFFGRTTASESTPATASSMASGDSTIRMDGHNSWTTCTKGVSTTAHATPASWAQAAQEAASTFVGMQQLTSPATTHAASSVYSNSEFPVNDRATTLPTPSCVKKKPANIFTRRYTSAYVAYTGFSDSRTVANAGRDAHTINATWKASAKESTAP
jgi:hypothetical protein